ncbi:MAG: hypothetical protein NZM12_00195, partial [Steroidobacteraceae bacterium]|nr:hypothetical protein [Steroidobacteraceae bacterium]
MAAWRYVWLIAVGSVALASRAAQVEIPPELRGWQSWVLDGAAYRNCPLLYAQSAGDAGGYRCAWPGQLQIDVDARGGNFAQRWVIDAPSWVQLPGSLEHWPRDVRINGAAAAVVAREGRPFLRLAVGQYAVSGRFVWESRPESLPIPVQTALVELTVDGQRIA